MTTVDSRLADIEAASADILRRVVAKAPSAATDPAGWDDTTFLLDLIRQYRAREQRVRTLHPKQQLPTAPDGYAICPTCDNGPAPGCHVPWPCPTIRALDGQKPTP